MTWSISASGKKEDVKTKIDEAHAPQGEAEAKAFEAAQALCHAQLDAMSSESVSVSASGHANACSVSISSS